MYLLGLTLTNHSMNEIELLKQRVSELESIIKGLGNSPEFSSKVRDIVIFDIDNSTSTTQTATDSRGDTVTIGKIQTTFGKVYFKGKVYRIALY